MIEPAAVKRRSEAAIIAASGQICDWLPTIGTDDLALRTPQEVADRALVIHCLVNLSFNAPTGVILRWLGTNDLDKALSHKERAIVERTGALSQDERNQLRWNIEALWSLAWISGFIDDVLPIQDVSEAARNEARHGDCGFTRRVGDPRGG